MVLDGLIVESRTRHVGTGLVAAILLGPLVRYENLAIAIPALGYLVWRRRAGIAAVLAAGIGGSVGAFSIYLHERGLAWLPTSVLFKSVYGPGGLTLRAIVENVRLNMLQRQAGLLILGLLFALAALLDRERAAAERALAAFAAVPVVLHVAFGQFGWWRYEVYVWAWIALALLYLFRDAMSRLVLRRGIGVTAVLAGAFVLLACTQYVYETLATPWGANNIYLQHGQMQRFATEHYRGPLLVKDVGWISFRNDAYVFDLPGFAATSHEQFEHLVADRRWFEELARDRGIELLLTYRRWIDWGPPGWREVGELRLDGARVTAGHPAVAFFASPAADPARLDAAFSAFERDLPIGATFVRAPEAAPDSGAE
jgi:hypothetical protein